MNMTYYKEEELLKVTETTDAWGIKEKSVTWEEHDIKRVDDYYLGLCTNCLCFFLRRQVSTEGHGCFMTMRNVVSSVVENNAEQYNKYAPKVAYGIVAWLLRYTYYDDELGCLSAEESIDTILNRYKEECYKRWQYQHQKKYHHYSVVEQNEAEIEKLEMSFLSQHIEQEREYINTFNRPTFIVEAHYKALMARCNEYLNYSTIKQQQSAPQAKEKDLECAQYLFGFPNCNSGNLLAVFKSFNTNKNIVVDSNLTPVEMLSFIRQADLSFIKLATYKQYFFILCSKFLYHDKNVLEGWVEEAIRKNDIKINKLKGLKETGNTKSFKEKITEILTKK